MKPYTIQSIPVILPETMHHLHPNKKSYNNYASVEANWLVPKIKLIKLKCSPACIKTQAGIYVGMKCCLTRGSCI